MKIAIICAAFGLLCGQDVSQAKGIYQPLKAYALTPSPDEFNSQWSPRRAWCEGAKAMVESVERNRDHWRQLLGQPKLTVDQVLRPIYEDGSPTTVVSSVDLYVVPPPITCDNVK